MNSRPQVQGVIFDMDGTLIDNMEFHEKSWLAFLEKHGIKSTQEEYAEKAHGTIDQVLRRYFGELPESQVRLLAEEKEALYRSIYSPHLKEIAGLTPFLQDLKSRRIPMAIATSGDRKNVAFTLDGLNITSFFDVIVSSEDVSVGKPDPESFILTAHRLGVQPANCLVFEDSLSGIASAHNAGMPVIALTTMHPQEKLRDLPSVMKIIRDFTEIDIDLL
jgi:beta-phosphoglucomutase